MFKIYKLIFVFFLCFSLNFSSGANLESDKNNYGTWINLWNYPIDIKAFLSDLESQNINIIYLQLGRSNTEAIKKPERVNELIKLAKEKNIKVIGWFYALLNDPVEDAQKFIEGANLLDIAGMAIDLEENVKAEKVNLFAQTVRLTLGENYPLIVITYSPHLRPLNSEEYPWKTIIENFDIIAPMLYWGKSTNKDTEVYSRTSLALSDLKDFIEKNKNTSHIKDIYPIGDLQNTSLKEIKSFVKACIDQELTNNISLYPYHLAKPEALSILKKEFEEYYKPKSSDSDTKK